MNESKPLVSVVIVTWNNEKDIKICLESILNQDYPNFKVIVVDNNSSDQTTAIIQNNFPMVHLIKEPVNHFLTGGNNIGIHYSMSTYDPEYIMVLNPDTKSEYNLISTLVESLEKHSDAYAVGPKIKFWNNTNEGKINSVGLFFDGFMQAYDIGFMEEDNGQYDQEHEVFGVTGTCILYRVSMMKNIGDYWDRIKMYMDEVEMFLRAHKAGYKVLFNPNTTVWHNYMASTNNNKNFNKENQKMRAWLFIALRHYTLKSKLAMIKKYLTFRIKNK